MDPDDKAIYESMLGEYTEALKTTTFNLALANARGKVKDGIISDLMAKLKALEPEPDSPKPEPDSPKP